MKMKIIALSVGLAVGSFAPVALADGSDPLGAVKTDIATVQADFQATHDVLMADAQKLQSDAALFKSGPKAQARASVKADWLQLKADFQAKRTKMQADWQQLHVDFKAARQSKSGTKVDRLALRQEVQQMRTAFQAGRAEVRQAVEAAHAAIRAARSNGASISAADAKTVVAPAVVPASQP